MKRFTDIDLAIEYAREQTENEERKGQRNAHMLIQRSGGFIDVIRACTRSLAKRKIATDVMMTIKPIQRKKRPYRKSI